MATRARRRSGLEASELTSIDTTTLPRRLYRVCRYTYDYSRNGRIDNEEHADLYVNVAKSLPRQKKLPGRCRRAELPVDSSTFDPAARNFVNYDQRAAANPDAVISHTRG